MKTPDLPTIWLSCPALRRSVIVILLLLLVVMLSACSSTPVHRVQYLTPEPAWLEPTPIYLSLDNLETYGQVRNRALSSALKAVGSCNSDKAVVRDWMKKALDSD